MKVLAVVSLVLSLGLTSCSKGPLPPESPGTSPNLSAGSLTASAGPDGILLENHSGATLRFAVVDSLFFEHGLAQWCMGQDECGTALAAGAQRLIPPDEIVGPPPRGKAVQVFWWDLRPGTPAEKSARFERIHLRLP
jgi:hypothetical protein